VLEIEPFGKAYACMADAECHLLRTYMQCDVDLPCLPIREGMTQTVGEQLIE